MEKKTIGRFISVLRKANGMTQRELAERLFVSDKTVSRWECDECTPDLTLIPAIAEIFGITTDELIRGERNNLSAIDEKDASKQRNKSDRQFKSMLYNRLIKYKNLTLISVGLIALSLIVAMIFNFGFLKGIVGFCVASVFLIASVICQTCFASSACLPTDEEDGHAEIIKKANSDIVLGTLKVVHGAGMMFAFILPIAFVGDAYAGLAFGPWLVMGTVFAIISLIAIYITYIFGVRKTLIKKGLLFNDEKEERIHKYKSSLLKKSLAIACGISAALLVGVLVLNSVGVSVLAKKQIFTDDDDWQSFREFMKNGKAYSEVESNFFVDAYEEPVQGVEDLENGDEIAYSTDYLCDKYGNECIPYDYVERFYSQLEYLEYNEDGTPAKVAVYTSKAMADAHRLFMAIEVSICTLIVVDFVVCGVMYAVKASKYK